MLRLFTFIFLLSLCVGSAAAAPVTGQDVSQLRTQLQAAEDAADKPAIIELSRRILAITPTDSKVWDTLAQTELETEDLDRLEQTLDAWQKAVRHPPPAIEDFRGDLAARRKDYQNAERHWLAFLASKPSPADAATEYDNLANLCATQQRWEDHANHRTKAIAAQDSAARRVARAIAFLRLHKWDAAYADMAKANKMDAADPEVKEWLPQFERLQRFLPQIKALGAQIAKSPDDPATAGLLLERARIFTLADRPLLALDDSQHALKLQPESMRARIQMAEALLDTGRPEDAAKLQINDKLTRAKDKHVSEEILRRLAAIDALLVRDQKDVHALTARADNLALLKQFTLALTDAQAAVAIDDKSADAHFAAASAFYNLGNLKEALAEIRTATELDPNDPTKWFCRGIAEAGRADFPAAIQSQTRSLNLHETVLALREREKCERRIGKTSEADADLRRINELGPEHE